MIFSEPASGTHMPALSDLLRLMPPEEVRIATDIGSAVDALTLLVGGRTGSLSATAGHEAFRVLVPANYPRARAGEAWLARSFGVFEGFRFVEDGWDGDKARAPHKQSIDAAEDLCVLFLPYSHKTFPVCSVDILGRPSFAVRDDNFYLHLVIENELSAGGHPLLSWYAVLNDHEYFEDEVEFIGSELPPSLKGILAESAV